MQVSDRIGRRMKLHDLHVLMAVAEAGSMNKAASLLNTGQSAISRSIADLERTVGVRLVDRSARRWRRVGLEIDHHQTSRRRCEQIDVSGDEATIACKRDRILGAHGRGIAENLRVA